MTETSRNLLVGIFVIASLAVLGTLMVWFGEAPSWLGGNEWTLRITGVREIRGIGEGAPVKLNGVTIGRVEELTFADPEQPSLGVTVVTKIKEKYSVPKDALAKIYGAAFGLGSGQVNIVNVGLDPELLAKENAAIYGEMASPFGDLVPDDFLNSVQRTVDHIGNLADAAVPVANNLDELLQRRTVDEVSRPGAAAAGRIANIATLIERLDRLVANVNTVLGDQQVQGDVKEVVSNLKTTSEQLSELAALWAAESQGIAKNLNEGIDSTEANLDETFSGVNGVLEQLDSGATSVAQALQHVAAGQGTAGLLVHDERLYEAAVLSLERLSELIASLQRVVGKIERDGYITVGQTTPVGTFTKDFPVGEKKD